MTTIEARSPTNMIIELVSKTRAHRERVFSECKWYFKHGLARRILLDPELSRSVQEFLDNATELFQRCVKMDEQTCDTHNDWAEQVCVILDKYEERQKMDYRISYRFVEVFNVMLAMMHPKGEISQISELGEDKSIAEAKRLLIKFEDHLKYLQRENLHDAQGAMDCWESPLSIKEEAFKKAQMNAAAWAALKTFPCKTAKQFETVYGFLKHLQSVYKRFEFEGVPIYRLKWMTSAIRHMALSITGELEVDRKPAETDKAVDDLVNVFYDMIYLWRNNTLNTRGVIAKLQDHVKRMKSNGKLHTRHLIISSFMFMLSSLKIFQTQRSQNSANELMRGYKVLRARLKRVDCFSDVGYQLIALWEHIMVFKAVKLESAYFVLDHQSDGKKNSERKITGVLVYFLCQTEKDALLLQKLHIAWMRPRKERERVFEEVCPKLAEFQRVDISNAEDSERRLKRLNILRKKDSLVINPRTLEERKAFQRDEELQQYLCLSDACRGPIGRFDNKWLENFVGGSWSIAEEKRRDPGKTEEAIWFEKMLDAQKQTMHIFWALHKNMASGS